MTQTIIRKIVSVGNTYYIAVGSLLEWKDGYIAITKSVNGNNVRLIIRRINAPANQSDK